MPYIVVLQYTNGTLSSDPFAVAIQARDLDKAIEKARVMAENRTKNIAITCRVVAVFDSLTGAIGPTVEKEFD